MQYNEDKLIKFPVPFLKDKTVLYVDSRFWVNHHLIFQKAKKVNMKIIWCNNAWLFAMSLIPFATTWVGSYPTSRFPLSLYFADMALAAITFHLMYYLIAVEHGEKDSFKLGPRNYVSLATYVLVAILGGLCPVAAYITIAIVTCWWIFSEKGKH